jgi:hypothetical protein
LHDLRPGPDHSLTTLAPKTVVDGGRAGRFSPAVADLRIASDGLPARVVKAHTREKFDRHRKYCATFNTGMKNHWASNRGYLELFAGLGLAIDDDTDEANPPSEPRNACASSLRD